jgi:Ca2+-binding RTX toxin-like protein
MTVIYGTTDSDTLSGTTSGDELHGLDGDDFFVIDHEDDLIVEDLWGGYDFAEIWLLSYAMADNLEVAIAMGAAGAHIVGNALANEIYGNDGDDTLEGGGGDDWIEGRGGADTMAGGDGDDFYLVEDETDIVVETEFGGHDTVDVTAAAFVMPDWVEDARIFHYWEVLPAHAITGNALDNHISVTYASAETIDGAGGSDTVSYIDSADADGVTVDLLTGLHEGAAADDTLISIENLVGSWADDELRGTDGANTLDGLYGYDVLVGRGGDDVYHVRMAEVVVVEASNGGDDEVRADWMSEYTLPDHVERLVHVGWGGFSGTGNALDNHLTGGADNDVLTGGLGADDLTGGAGADLFVVSGGDSGTGAAADRILDFSVGEDMIDLSGMDADSGTAGDQSFSWIGGAAFSGLAGELRYAFDGVDTRIQGDTDGNGVADFEIVLAGALTPLAGDFYL